jgi:hypothetical protein
MSSILCMLRRESSEVPSVCCWTSQVRQDGLSARKDLQALEIREELHTQERLNGKASSS